MCGKTETSLPSNHQKLNLEMKIHRDLAVQIHKIFLEGMEARYKDMLSFVGFLIPSLGGFFLLLNKYESYSQPMEPPPTFFIGTLGVIGVFLYGAAYNLALSYRYRYLQASVYWIEETFGAVTTLYQNHSNQNQ